MKYSKLLTGALGACIAGAILWPAAYAKESHDAMLSRNLTVFNTIVKELESNYVDSVPVEESFQRAIYGYMSNLDPYTEYFAPDDKETLKMMTTGTSFGGVGTYLLDRDSSTYISRPMADTPAARAGLRAGDRILRIDSVDASRMSSSDVTKILRGTPGTSVTLLLERPYAQDSLLTVTLEREKVEQPSVPYYGVVGDAGYVALTQFVEKTPQEVREALESFKGNPDVKYIVLDLRGNGGGLVDRAVEVAANFLPKGTEVVRTRGREASSEKVYKTLRSPIFPDIPLFVLTDGGTASSAEIVAGAMQDLDRGVLIGSRSFGKGLVQGTRQLPYDGILKVTVAKYYLPSGRLIQAVDYSRRNEDGSVSRTPDSLANVFHTLHGREVRDGGGLKPDIEVEWGKNSRILYNAVADHWVFDFATKYAAEHPQIAPPEEFEITDEIYEEFKKSIDPERFKYDKVCEDLVKQLKEVATSEGYMNEETEEAFATMGRLLTHNLDKDLDTSRPEISKYLADELMERYYYDAGRLRQNLRNDPAMAKVREIMAEPGAYKKMLQ